MGPWQGRTKANKNGPHYLPAWHSIFGVGWTWGFRSPNDSSSGDDGPNVEDKFHNLWDCDNKWDWPKYWVPSRKAMGTWVGIDTTSESQATTPCPLVYVSLHGQRKALWDTRCWESAVYLALCHWPWWAISLCRLPQEVTLTLRGLISTQHSTAEWCWKRTSRENGRVESAHFGLCGVWDNTSARLGETKMDSFPYSPPSIFRGLKKDMESLLWL